MIVADTGAVLALIDRDHAQHRDLLSLYRSTAREWILPWAILPEIDYLLARDLPEARAAFLADLEAATWTVEWGNPHDLARAGALDRRYADLSLGLVDTMVMAIAERLGARAIATLDLRDFGAVELAGRPLLTPRDPLGS